MHLLVDARSVRFAPAPEDIYWENLTADTHRLFIFKALFINMVVFIVLFFFTSPTYIISQIELILNFKTFTPSEKVRSMYSLRTKLSLCLLRGHK